jgi:WD40 repeat protein
MGTEETVVMSSCGYRRFDQLAPKAVQRSLRHPALAAFALIFAAFVPLTGRCESISKLFGKLSGSHMNDVAVKVTELPNPDSKIYPLGLDFGVDGNRIAVESQSGKIHIWDWRGKRVEQTLVLPDGGNALGVTNPIQFSVDGRFLAACEISGAGDVVVRVWDAATGLIARDISAGIGIESRGSCTGGFFTPDGKQFVRLADTVGTPGNNLIVYAMGTWQPLWGLKIEGLSPVSIAISPNGELAAIAGTVFVMPQDVKNPIERFQQTRTASRVNFIDLRQRKIAKVISMQGRTMGPVAWSPDGRRVAIVGGSVEIFDFPSGNELVNETIENAGSMNVRFTSDGRYLVDSDLNGMGKGLGVRIWDGQRQKLLQHISVGDVGAIAISRDGKYLAVGETGRTTIWQFK